MINSNQMNRIKYLLVLLHIFNSRTKITHKLSKLFTDYESLQCADQEHLTSIKLSAEKINALRNLDQSIQDAIEQELIWASKEDQHLIAIDSEEYPILLKEISDAPLLLFVKGNKQVLRSPQLAIVGSRNPSPVGLENGYAFAQQLAKIGLTITSGFAIGIDAAAHRGALAASGRTVAVMGAGLNYIYPQRHRQLAPEIVANGGALISEFPLQVAPLAINFPQRNRIISGLSLGTLVVEATLRSGSLITAHQAAEQGREVFAIPNSIHNQLASGCHALIRQGAKLIENINDIIEDLPPLEIATMTTNINEDMEKDKDVISYDFANNISTETKNSESIRNSFNLDGKYKKILACIDYETTPVDVLAKRSNLTITEITSILLQLELKGCVQKINGGYVLCANRHITV